MWLRVKGFTDKIKSGGKTYNFKGKPSFVLVKKLQALKCNLKKWNKEVLANVSPRKDVALEQLNHWDSLERLRPLSEEDKRRDNNTKFFHHMANTWRRGNFINSLTVRSVRLTEEEELKEGIGSYFKSMFEETQVRRTVVVLGLFRNLDSLDNETLKGRFSEKEAEKGDRKSGIEQPECSCGGRQILDTVLVANEEID
ncbi:hypothetical protein CK203_001462 [Vitis vinifera]|uniref:Uncharacterized protein n=1 Tax=Vitis vinifera TaxID=29760 RepID=A0A438KLV2_VITVI|nr:hypothetical protein CK203_001462 [Vitis vinifera]